MWLDKYTQALGRKCQVKRERIEVTTTFITDCTSFVRHQCEWSENYTAAQLSSMSLISKRKCRSYEGLRCDEIPVKKIERICKYVQGITFTAGVS